MRKFGVVLAGLLLCLSLSLSARAMSSVSLGFGATYLPPMDESFSSGMEDSRNWILSGELNGRFLFLQTQGMVLLTKSEEETLAVQMIGLAGLNLPIVGSWLLVEISGGVGLRYVPKNQGVDYPYYVLSGGEKAAADELSFLDAVLQSPIYLQMGIGADLGPLGLRARYLIETNQTIEQVIEKGQWWEIFVPNTGCLSLAVLLKMK